MTGSTRQNKTYLIGVAGGSGSGKTYFARALRGRLGPQRCGLLFQDNFYHDQSARFDRDGGAVNFDHPDAIDFALLASCLRDLKQGKPVEIPRYDFVTHSRLPQKERFPPAPLLIVDGILIFHEPALRGLFDERIFFDAPEELRYQRRLERDVRERGRQPEGVRAQFLAQVKPMHDEFVEPSRRFATRIVRDTGDFTAALEECALRLVPLCAP